MRIAALIPLILPLTLWAACSSSSSGDADLGHNTGPEAGTGSPPAVCNGHAELCSRKYTEVAFPGTHDADATMADKFVAADQTYSVADQLAMGVRVLHFEMQPYQGDTYLCHAFCGIGSMLLLTELQTVQAFVVAHPTEVVTLLMESQNTTSDLIATAVIDSGLMPFVHTQAAGTAWPTLGDMIEHGDHVVLFNADQTGTGGTSYPWLHDRFARTWETPWNNKTPQDFAKCDADRGAKGNDIYVVDTYREDEAIASIGAARSVNYNSFLIDRLMTCQQSQKTLPNFVMVNFFEVGDLFHDVDILNGFTTAPDDDLSKFPPATFPLVDDAGVVEDAGATPPPVDAGDAG
ncbi:MAG: hypothetical protein ABI461_08610 [Polyangiaceae bacterium]